MIAVSSGFGPVHVVMSLLAAGMIGNQLLQHDGGRSPQVHQIISNLSPDDGWIMIFSALLILSVALIPGRRAQRKQESGTKNQKPAEQPLASVA
jgi:hypothetical protein